jgi:peptidyl-prolyl cis-trans isomerase A (cyclophilin A)
MPRAAGTYANFITMKGNFTCRLFEQDAPRTVANFIHYAKDKKQYDGTIFHRVIQNFLIQGGDPTGKGVGGFENMVDDEFKGSPHNFNKPGRLAVASAGVNANGSQFFITVVPASFLTGKHTIFGEVVEGFDVVEKISKAPVHNDRPQSPIVLQTLTIERV